MEGALRRSAMVSKRGTRSTWAVHSPCDPGRKRPDCLRRSSAESVSRGDEAMVRTKRSAPPGPCRASSSRMASMTPVRRVQGSRMGASSSGIRSLDRAWAMASSLAARLDDRTRAGSAIRRSRMHRESSWPTSPPGGGCGFSSRWARSSTPMAWRMAAAARRTWRESSRRSSDARWKPKMRAARWRGRTTRAAERLWPCLSSSSVRRERSVTSSSRRW